jgi:methylmalonyl-CoA mutase cobalamin-binding subunit
MEGKNIVTGVIGVDVHIMGMRIIEHALRRSGFTVHSLWGCRFLRKNSFRRP